MAVGHVQSALVVQAAVKTAQFGCPDEMSRPDAPNMWSQLACNANLLLRLLRLDMYATLSWDTRPMHELPERQGCMIDADDNRSKHRALGTVIDACFLSYAFVVAAS